ncbi:hypothetical protein ACHQM5_009876 [Ranunculus cassubicifolius]
MELESSNSSWVSNLLSYIWEPEKQIIGVLSYEVSTFMTKVIHLWNCLSDKQIAKTRKQILSSQGVRKLVSKDHHFLLGLLCREIIENLQVLVKYVGGLGKKCNELGLQQFEHVFDDFVNNNVDLYGWEYNVKKMERKVNKMGRFVAVNASLYQEMEVLDEMERSLRRMERGNGCTQIGLLKFQQKVVWQRQEVNNVRESSLWVRTFDYTVRLLARSLFSIFGRVKLIFGNHLMEALAGIDKEGTIDVDHLPRSHSMSTALQSSVHPSPCSSAQYSSVPFGRSYKKSGSLSSTNTVGSSTTRLGLVSGKDRTRERCQIHNESSNLHQKQPHSKGRRFAPVGPFKGCITSGRDSPVVHSIKLRISDHRTSNHVNSGVTNVAICENVGSFDCSDKVRANLAVFRSKLKVLKSPPFTLGAAALALHYANIIIVIENLVPSPHLIAPDARDDLYNMLPTSLKAALRARLKSYSMNITSHVHDTSFVVDWSEALTRILEWLAPLAHNMRRWQTERNLEQQHVVSRSNVFLVQSLYFANQEKTEAAIIELLVGLNYLWRFGRELDRKSLQECARGRSFDSSLHLNG